jgi:hypothetical protein
MSVRHAPRSHAIELRNATNRGCLWYSWIAQKVRRVFGALRAVIVTSAVCRTAARCGRAIVCAGHALQCRLPTYNGAVMIKGPPFYRMITCVPPMGSGVYGRTRRLRLATSLASEIGDERAIPNCRMRGRKAQSRGFVLAWAWRGRVRDLAIRQR